MAKQSGKRRRRQFRPEFKAEAVRLCKVGDRGVAQVARDLDLTETALREWVKRAEVDAGKAPPGRPMPESASAHQPEELAFSSPPLAWSTRPRATTNKASSAVESVPRRCGDWRPQSGARRPR